MKKAACATFRITSVASVDELTLVSDVLTTLVNVTSITDSASYSLFALAALLEISFIGPF